MEDWMRIAEEKRRSIDELIPEEWRISNPPTREEQRDVTGDYIHQFLSAREIEITTYDAVKIVELTTTAQLTAVEVTKAFCHRAALAHQLCGCLLEIFFEDAVQQAQALDDYLRENKKMPKGMLHGLPVSLKDQFHVKGVETTMGYVGWHGTFQGQKGTGKEKVFESELVRELRALGAVLYCKTSVPHTLMSGETINNIIGYCWNPKNRNLSAGGSSGGEGALIAFRGSPLGFGSDIGGSVRIPAGFNGLFGLRPSAGRIPYEGAANSMDGQNTILSVLGPISTSIPSLRLAFKAILSQQPWLHDPLCLELPWRENEESKMQDLLNSSSSSSGKHKLAFGVWEGNGNLQLHPPVARALNLVTSALSGLGHQMVDWNPEPSHSTLTDLCVNSWIFDGGADVHKAFALSGEPPLPQLEMFYGREPIAEKGAIHIHAHNVAKREAQKAYLDYWNDSADLTESGRPVDCIICPVAPHAAISPHNARNARHYFYTVWVNTLDYTTVVIPVTHIDKDVDVVNKSFKPLNEEDAELQAQYDPESWHGGPVSVQLIGRRLQEEKMLVLAEYISKALENNTKD